VGEGPAPPRPRGSHQKFFAAHSLRSRLETGTYAVSRLKLYGLVAPAKLQQSRSLTPAPPALAGLRGDSGLCLVGAAILLGNKSPRRSARNDRRREPSEAGSRGRRKAPMNPSHVWERLENSPSVPGLLKVQVQQQVIDIMFWFLSRLGPSRSKKSNEALSRRSLAVGSLKSAPMRATSSGTCCCIDHAKSLPLETTGVIVGTHNRRR